MTDLFLSGVLAPPDGALEPRVLDSLGFSPFFRRVCVTMCNCVSNVQSKEKLENVCIPSSVSLTLICFVF